jgi:uncharacterized protein (DUF58 family)
MIYPQNRLLLLVIIFFLPCLTLLGLEIGNIKGVILLPFGLLCIIVGIDAFIVITNTGQVKVYFPDLVRISNHSDGKIVIKISSKCVKDTSFRIGLCFNDDFIFNPDGELIKYPKSQPLVETSISCTPLKRGSFKFTHCYIEQYSLLEFWSARSSKKINLEIKVYPNLSDERRVMAGIFLNQKQMGFHTQRLLGQGKSFSKLRDYIHGDPLNSIHWKATAKRGHLVTKEFEIEKTQQVYVIIDSSRLSNRISKQSEEDNVASDSPYYRPDTIFEKYLVSALIMGLVAERQGDQFGLLAFDNKVNKFIRAKSGPAHFQICKDAIYSLYPEIVTPNFEELATYIHLNIRRRALLIFLTSLDIPVIAESFINSTKIISKKHLIYVSSIKTHETNQMYTEQTPHTTKQLYSFLGKHIKWQSNQDLIKILKKRGIKFSQFDKEELCLQLISQYMNVKQQQIL